MTDMNIFICIKQVPDTDTKIKLNADSSGIDTAGIKWIVSPYDENAIEEALRVKEKNAGSTVTVLSAGPARVVDALRTALAMGADNAVHVDVADNADGFLIGKALAAAIQKEGKPDLVFAGKEAIDDGASVTAQVISEALGIPCVMIAAAVTYEAGKVTVKREVEGGSAEVIEVATPVLIGAHKSLNDPRFPALPNIMKAKKKEVKVYKTADLGLDASAQKTKLKNFQLPAPKPPGKKLSGDLAAQAKELAKLLREEAKVI